MARRFAAGLAAAGKTNNAESAHRLKIELRRLALEAIGPDNAVVLDAYAGSGEMHKGIWHRASRYVGCDTEFYRDEREMFACDNRRLFRCLDLSAFNVFDLDAYGSPWELALILAARRQLQEGERIALIITDGSAIAGRLNATSNAFLLLTGTRMMAGMTRDYERLHTKAIHAVARRMGATLEKHWLLKGRGARMYYSSVILRG